MPSTATWTGSDQGPAGSSAVTKKLATPLAVNTVVIIQKRPSWYRIVGANTPPDEKSSVPDRSSCDTRSSAFPTWVQVTRSVEVKIGTPGK